ncbi:Cytosolic endo-beta-N-acetylglucosaminidase 2 [Camellia lanceoleosa]|uniref:Cytosolic endo-beta-N-acetylglucosaminidase 2 n=1 Tax=Camellia lanceoleosa TaxID=1840588 RepID=A0ACC0J0G0_9ERIC|nr:Cytosolic endo-beta-N-acetylglucosaminidase 2 [Camellia lanceoleosa]
MFLFLPMEHKVLGTFITEWDDGRVNANKLLATKESAHMYAELLTELATALGFDGWLDCKNRSSILLNIKVMNWREEWRVPHRFSKKRLLTSPKQDDHHKGASLVILPIAIMNGLLNGVALIMNMLHGSWRMLLFYIRLKPKT